MNFWERDDNFYKFNEKQNTNGFRNADTCGVGEDDVRDKINEYASKSQDELMSELLTTATRMKGEGTWTSVDLENFFERVSVFLNSEQRERMRELINMLKR